MGCIFLVFIRRLWLLLPVLAGFLGECAVFSLRVEGLRPLDALFRVIHPHSIEYRTVHKSTTIFAIFSLRRSFRAADLDLRALPAYYFQPPRGGGMEYHGRGTEEP